MNSEAAASITDWRFGESLSGRCSLVVLTPLVGPLARAFARFSIK
jgi:hypothetical protein